MKETMICQTTTTQMSVKEFTKEGLWRELAVKMVKEMPFDKLAEVFAFSDFDPETIDPNDLSILPRRKELRELKENGLVKLYAQITP